MDPVASYNNILELFSCPNFRFIHANILDKETVHSTLEGFQVDCVLHFAANSHVQKSFNNSFEFTENNVLGTHTLLDTVRKYGKVKRFIHVSTDEVYGETNGVPANEERTPLAPTNPYAASKAAAEMYVMAYRKSYGFPVIMVRGNNVYGPCQYPESRSSCNPRFFFFFFFFWTDLLTLFLELIPWFTNLLLKGRKLTLQGDGTNTRRFLYAADAANAYDTILHKGLIGEIYNMDSGWEVENIQVARRILELFGIKRFDEHITYVADRPFNDHDYALDGHKLQDLGWSQYTDFDSGLATTVEWYKKNLPYWWDSIPDEQKVAS